MTENAIQPLRVLGLVGSLRRQSLNRGLMAAAQELGPDPMEIDVFDLDEVPLYNGDLDNDRDRPAAVRRLKHAIADADAVLIATPEFNHSVPGVLQNAIDWASRPGMKSPLRDKPVAIMGASPGAIGTARAQQQLKLVLMSTLSLVMPHPGFVLGQAKEKFAADGTLTHGPTREFLREFLREFAGWTASQTGPGSRATAVT
jgi:chromate reductase